MTPEKQLIPALTQRGILLPPDTTLADYYAIGRDLIRVRDWSTLMLADYAKQGVAIHGEQAKTVWRQLEIDLGVSVTEQLELCLGVPALPPIAEREWSLSSEHYMVAATECETQEDAARWLGVAVSAQLDARQLQLSIRAGEIRRAKPSAPGTRVALPNLYAVRNEFTLFASKAPAAALSDVQKAEARKVLAPIVEYFNALQ